jgi:hypothetical protein
MPNMNEYPATVEEVLDRNIKLKPAALLALREFSRSRPWRGSLVDRWQKFQTLNRELSAAYGIEPPTLVLRGNGKGDSGGSFYSPANHTICISGRLSVVSLLHELAHARGMDERGACRWSISVFARIWPKSYSRCRHEGHVLRAERRAR